MKPFNIGDLKIPVPIIQGGMGIGISLSGLASAVANMGGVGVISMQEKKTSLMQLPLHKIMQSKNHNVLYRESLTFSLYG